MNVIRSAAVVAILAWAVDANGATQEFAGECGPSRFVVTVDSASVLERVFTLFKVVGQRRKALYTYDGGVLHVACLKSRSGKKYVVFQAYCGGSGCPEYDYGVVDPTTGKLLVEPTGTNIPSEGRVSQLLGYQVPHLFKHAEAFCCE